VILSAGSLLRAGFLLLLAVILQLSAISQIGIFGGSADLVVLAVAAIAFYGGSISGSAAGFTAGFLLDLLTGATMGAASLVLAAVGYAVGRFGEVRGPGHGLVAVPAAAAATAAWLIAFGAVSLMLETGAQVSPLVLRDLVATVVLNALLAVPVFAVARRLLQPSSARQAGRLVLRGMEV
jgi:rod shape-determining protein MreD